MNELKLNLKSQGHDETRCGKKLLVQECNFPAKVTPVDGSP